MIKFDAIFFNLKAHKPIKVLSRIPQKAALRKEKWEFRMPDWNTVNSLIVDYFGMLKYLNIPK